MFRPNRILLALIFSVALAAAAGPALAQGPGPFVLNPALLIHTVTVMGAGETLEIAEANALADIRTTYFVLSYTTSNPICNDLFAATVVGNQMQEPPQQFCSIVVTARVIRKATWISE